MNDREQIQKRIKKTELQLKKINSQQNKNEVCEDLCNSLILQKAILKKQLEELDKNPVVESLKKLIPHQKKLICDYFN